MRKKLIILTLAALLAAVFHPATAAEKKYSVGDKVQVIWKNIWHACTILEEGEDNSEYKIRFEDDERIFDRWMAVSKLHNFTWKMGDMVFAKREGKWIPAKVLAAGTLQYKVAYTGGHAYADEWVGPGRIKDLGYSVGDRVQVFWNNDWYPAKVIAYENGRYKVHYEGFPDNYDQWVTVDKIKK